MKLELHDSPYPKTDQRLNDLMIGFREKGFSLHDWQYPTAGIFHVLFMQEAKKLKTPDQAEQFIGDFSVHHAPYRTSYPFTFSIDPFIRRGLLVPDGLQGPVHAFDQDLWNHWPGFSQKDLGTPEHDRKKAIAEEVRSCAWKPEDFLNQELLGKGTEFGMGVWNKSNTSLKEYSYPRMDSVHQRYTDSLIAYYQSILQRLGAIKPSGI